MTEQSTTLPLSRTGRIRRDTMLVDLQRAMKHRHTRRRQVSRTLAVGALVITGGMATLFAMHPATPPPPTALTPTVVHTATHVVWVKTDPSIGERMELYTATATIPRVIVVDDRELLAALEEIDRPSGLIRMNGLVKLTAPVTDKELKPSDPGDSPPA